MPIDHDTERLFGTASPVLIRKKSGASLAQASRRGLMMVLHPPPRGGRGKKIINLGWIQLPVLP